MDINRFIDLWAERHGFESLAEFRGKMNYGNAESDVTLSICNVTFAVWAYAPHAENVEQIMNRKVNQHLIC